LQYQILQSTAQPELRHRYHDHPIARVATSREKAPTGRLLAAVGALKFGFAALLANFLCSTLKR